MGRRPISDLEKPFNKLLLGKLLHKSAPRKELYAILTASERTTKIGNLNSHLANLTEQGYVYTTGIKRKQIFHVNINKIVEHFIEHIYSLDSIYGFIKKDKKTIRSYLTSDCFVYTFRNFLEYWAEKSSFHKRPFYYWFNYFIQEYYFGTETDGTLKDTKYYQEAKGIDFLEDSKDKNIKLYHKIKTEIIEPYYYWLQDLALNVNVTNGQVFLYNN